MTKKKKIHVSFEGLVCFASDLYPQTDLESENGPESLLRRWLTFTTALEVGLSKHLHFTGERLSNLVKVTRPGGSWD